MMAQRYRAVGRAARAARAARRRGCTLSPRGGWQILAQGDGGDLTMHSDATTSTRALRRFVAAYRARWARWRGPARHVDCVDLRYRNGFAAHVPGFREKPARRKS